MARRSPLPRCRFCRKVDDAAVMVAEGHRVGIARGSTRYTVRTYYHHSACLAAFEAREAELAERDRRELEAEVSRLTKQIADENARIARAEKETGR